MPLDQQADEALMEAYQQGDTRAFEVLLRRHRRPVFNFLLRHLGNRALAEDMLQEVFLRVVKASGRYTRRAKFTTWLYTIARNLCVDQSRRAKHRKASSLDQPIRSGSEDNRSLGDVLPDRGPAVDRRAMGGTLKVHIKQAVATLSTEQREVFLMRETLNLPFKEIATVVGVSENTVKSRMRYALIHLRQQLEEYRDFAQSIG